MSQPWSAIRSILQLCTSMPLTTMVLINCLCRWIVSVNLAYLMTLTIQYYTFTTLTRQRVMYVFTCLSTHVIIPLTCWLVKIWFATFSLLFKKHLNFFSFENKFVFLLLHNICLQAKHSHFDTKYPYFWCRNNYLQTFSSRSSITFPRIDSDKTLTSLVSFLNISSTLRR